ncbi:MAG: hypothetical protein ACRDB0_06580 [Paraclostridium sp.]
MKSFEEIYSSIKSKFYNKTKIDVARGTVIDMIFYSISNLLSDVYKYIESNKKPYLFTNQKEKELDSTGYFLQCPRLTDESDENYFYRLQNWTKRNAACNTTAIEEALRTLEYTSGANHVPYTKGAATATIYLVPNKYEEEYINKAINEAKEKLKSVINPSSIVDYVVPTPAPIKLVAYLDVKKDSDTEYIKRTIESKVKEYINKIAPGESLMLGTINNLALDVEGVEYFNVVQLYINNEEATSFEVLQTVNKKFLFEQFIWWEVEK